jgi:hypothetical protein
VWATNAGSATAAVVFSFATAAVASGVVMTDQVAKCPPRRTFNRELRIIVHELGHLLIARLRDAVVTSVSIIADDTSEGRVMGAWPFKAFARGNVDAFDIRAELQPRMPRPCEDHRPAANVTHEVMEQVIEYMGGRAAEKLVLRGRPSPAVDDYRQARELAAIVCASPKSIDRFLKFCEQQAEDLLRPHIDLIFALIPVLRARREMTGTEVDEAIATILTRFDLAAEQKRRRQWQQRVEKAAAFKPWISRR